MDTGSELTLISEVALWALVKVRACKGQVINGDLVHIWFPVGLLRVHGLSVAIYLVSSA